MKTPGDGFTYSVATIEVEQTWIQPEYSNFAVDNPPTGPIVFNNGDRKQVVLLQCVDGDGVIQWQRYFFGSTPLLPKESRRPTNARAISVWTAGSENPEDTRIAICGETYDDRIPLSQDPAGFPQPVLTVQPDPTGFVAVYDGAGNLLWTHHFFGLALPGQENQPDCAITDVSIRVEGEGEAARDVVTYCGISSYGNPAGGNAWLDPILPFEGPALDLSAGDTDFGPFQWDGIVGRISRPHAAPYNPQNPLAGLKREFLAIVGGPDQDGLFGIAEMDDQRFVAVGSAHDLGIAAPPIGFPFTPLPPTAWPYRVATIVGFDAAPTRLPTPQRLELENCLWMGSCGGPASHASDVIVQQRTFGPPQQNAVFVVGTTADPDFLSSVYATTTSQWDVLRGPTDGFLLAGLDVPAADSLQMGGILSGAGGGVFIGGDGVDGITGIHAWNEHTDHVQVCGYSSYLGPYQIQVASFVYPFPFVPLRRVEFGATADDDRPAVMGERNATDGAGGLPFATGLAGNIAAGGGIAVDERGRLTVVGSTWGDTGYPVAGGGRSYRGSQDAVRTEFDLLPIGVGRTDGTGSTVAGLPAPLPPVGYSGGTTPICLVDQTPYGMRVGEPQPSPALRRMLIDYEGDNGAGALPVIWSSRPSELGDIVVAALQFGLPSATPLMLDGAELWTLNNNPLLISEAWVGNNQRPWSVPFTVALPPGPAQFSAQVACLVLTPLTSGNCAGQLTTFAGPALYFEYL